jgi:hypothetical protein
VGGRPPLVEETHRRTPTSVALRRFLSSPDILRDGPPLGPAPLICARASTIRRSRRRLRRRCGGRVLRCMHFPIRESRRVGCSSWWFGCPDQSLCCVALGRMVLVALGAGTQRTRARHRAMADREYVSQPPQWPTANTQVGPLYCNARCSGLLPRHSKTYNRDPCLTTATAATTARVLRHCTGVLCGLEVDH